MLSSLVLLRYQHEGLQPLPQAAQLETLASGRSLGTLLAVEPQLLPLPPMLGLAADQPLLLLHHNQQLHNLGKWTQDKCAVVRKENN